MKSIPKLFLMFFLGLMPLMASAVVSVDRLNYPVWVERGADTVPLAAGARLQIGDIVQTGSSGRVWLKVEDGSVVKLGQNARFSIEGAAFREADSGTVLEGVFNVLKGAFRFTSGFFTTQLTSTRQLDFQVGAITVGIRGTDIWGRATDDEDFVALLEGRIEVASTGRETAVMDQALTLYRKASGEPADPVTVVEAAVVEGLATETELDASLGISGASGVYSLVLHSYTDPGHADVALKRYRDAGYAVQARPVEVGGISYTRIQLEGLIHPESANNLRRTMIAEGLIDDAWINAFE
ncbi:MAG: FecR domain-containing protein [Gammaproteobacteria bacterium]|nr:FecR domain-containing protein [Gammaproteobacteria bacterium]